MKAFLLHAAARGSSSGPGDMPEITELHQWFNRTGDVPLGIGLVAETDAGAGRKDIYFPVPDTGKWFFGLKLLAAPEYNFFVQLSWKATFSNIEAPLPSFIVGDKLWVAYDGDNQQAWFALNSGYWNDDEEANPELGVGGLQTTQAPNRRINTFMWSGNATSRVEALIHPYQWTRAAPYGYSEMVIDGEYA